MPGEIKFVDGGTVTTPKGFTAGATYAGIKTYAADKLDLGLLFCEKPSTVAGVFTTSKVRSPFGETHRGKGFQGQGKGPCGKQRHRQCLRR